MEIENVYETIARQIQMEVDIIQKGKAFIDDCHKFLSICDAENKSGLEELRLISDRIAQREQLGEDVTVWNKRRVLCLYTLKEAMEAADYVRNIKLPKAEQALSALREDLQKKLFFVFSFISSSEDPDSKITWN